MSLLLLMQAEYRDKRTQHMASLDAAVHFDLYAELDIDDDERSFSPGDRPSSRHAASASSVAAGHGLYRTDSGSSTTSSRAPAAVGSEHLDARSTRSDAYNCGQTTQSKTNDDDLTSVTSSVSWTMASVAELDDDNGGEEKCRPTTTARRRAGGPVGAIVIACEPTGSDSTPNSADLKVSASEPLFRRNRSCGGDASFIAAMNRGSCSPPTSGTAESKQLADLVPPQSPAASFVVGGGDSSATTSPLSSVLSLPDCADSAVVRSYPVSNGTHDDADEDSYGSPGNSPNNRTRGKFVADAESDDQRRRPSSAVTRTAAVYRRSISSISNDEEETMTNRTSVEDNTVMKCSSSHLHHQQQQQQPPPARFQPTSASLRRCRIDKELVLNSTALETS
jgi:hypothetical protein